MGKIYQSIARFISEKPVGDFIEIGSERGEVARQTLDCGVIRKRLDKVL